MKNKWLIGALSCVMATTLCLGIVACNKTPKTGMTDEEIAQAGITTLNGIYLDGDGKVKNYETPDDYQVLAKTRVAEEFLNVTWSVTSETENIQKYVSIGTEADASARYTIDITRATFDIEYTLTASITVGQATKTANYAHKIPKKSSEDAITATLDFSTDAARTSISTVQQIWESNGLKLTNDKAGSSTATNNAGDNARHIRLYAGSKVTIEFPGIKIITFRSLTTYEYFPNLQTVLSNAGYTEDQLVVDEEAGTVKLTLTTPVDFLEFTATKQLRITSIDVEGTEGGATAEQNVAAVKAWLTVSQTSFNSQTTIALATEKVGTTISWAMKEASEYAKVEDGNLVITKLPEEGEQKATLVATISSGTAKDTKEFTLTFTPEIKLENDGTAEHPYTVADVYKLASTLESGKVYQENGQSVSMYVKGIVTAEGSWASSHSNWQDVIIADTPSGTQTLKLYGLNPGAGLSETNGPKVGGTLVVVGALKNYNGTLELTFDGSIKLTITDYTAPVDNRTAQQKVDAALQALADTFTVTKAGETDLPASTEPDVTFAWSTTDQTYPITGNKINVSALPAANATVTATVTATCGTEAVTNNTKTVTITIRAESTEPAPGSGDGTVDHPYSVAEATEIIAGLGTETVYKVNGEIALVYVKGIVTVKGKTDDYGIKEYFMADVAGDTENDISVYNLNWGTVKKGTEINVGDTIIVTGYLQNFNGTYEVSSYKDTSWHNGTVEAHTPVGGTVTPPTPSEEVKLPDGDVKLDFSSVTEKGTEITSGDATDYFKGFTESADFTAATVTEKVYKGNGTGGGDYENAGGMLKLGTSKVSAIITLTFAKNVTKVVIMAQGWPGKSDTLAVNDGTAQTMSGSEKALYTFELTAPAKEIKITSNLRAFIFGIVVTFEGGTTTPKTDAEKLADAKAALKLSKTSLDAVGAEVELPATQGDASVTYELSAASDLVKIEGGKLTVLKLPESDTEITIKATLTVGQETDNVDLKVTVKAASTEPATNYGTLEDPLTVAEALALAKTECATQDDVTKELVYVTGVALTTPENKGSYYGSVEIADAGTQTKILIYSVSVRSGVVAPAQNDVLVVCGYIKNYYGTIEFATNNNIYVYIEKNTRGESTITLGEHAGATVTGLEEGLTKTNGTEVSFTVTAEQGKKIVAVKANGETLKAESENTYKFTVEGNMTITVETAGESEAVAELLYSLNSNEQPVGTNNNYANTCQVTYNGVTWVVAGNAKVDSGGAQKPWRFGGKNITAVDRALTGKTAISGKVTKITLQLTDGGSITVNSVTLKVYKSDPTISGAELVSTKDIAYQKGVAVDIMAGEDDWTNCFFQIVFNVTVGSSNKYVSIDTLEFYGTPAAAAAAAVSAPAEVAVLPGKQF